MSYANRCHECAAQPLWRIDRRGDAVVSWACAEHLSAVCVILQRPLEVTELVVTLHEKGREVSELSKTFNKIVNEHQAVPA